MSAMNPRIDFNKKYRQALAGLFELERFVEAAGIDKSLLELVKLRASQINGCAFCIDMHTKNARKAGESEQRLYALSAWHETPFYTDRERIALQWTEALTLIAQTEISDGLYSAAKEQFGEDGLVVLTMAIVSINGWNRLAISFRTVPGSYNV
ncbi:conserved hypothetical protein [Candidatus Zixiibacteriota bacterium]|nr:conserved hypothetical protein [candidate division Zixibacteria bacterium]